jgi:hypothetical protein
VTCYRDCKAPNKLSATKIWNVRGLSKRGVISIDDIAEFPIKSEAGMHGIRRGKPDTWHDGHRTEIARDLRRLADDIAPAAGQRRDTDRGGRRIVSSEVRRINGRSVTCNANDPPSRFSSMGEL